MFQYLFDPVLDLLLLPVFVFLILYAVRVRNRRKKARKQRKLFEAAIKAGDLERARRCLRRHYKALGGGKLTLKSARALEKELMERMIDQKVPTLATSDAAEHLD